jgi:serine/threonine protein kinase
MPDDYVIGAVMGDGLAGPRFAGRYRPSGHAVALEEIPHELLNRPDFVERLAISGRRAAALSTPHVVQVYDLVRVAHRLYLITELCRGRTLAALIAGEPLPLRAALTVADAVLAGVEEVHAAGLIHGDIRPEVVVVTPTGDVRLTELGLAAVLAEDPSMRGSPALPPPEGGAPSRAADLYAAACLLRDLVDAAKPEPGAVPDELGALITRALSPTATERPSEASSLRRELEGIAAEMFGPEWRVNSGLAARVSRPIGPPPSQAAAMEKKVVLPAAAASAEEPSEKGEAASAPVATALREAPGAPVLPPPPPSPVGPPPSMPGREEGLAWPMQRQPPPRSQRKAEPALPWTSRQRRRRRVAVAGLIIVVLAVLAAFLFLFVASPSPTGPRALAVGTPIRLSVLPAATGSCGTTFTVVATGPLSGNGTLVYRWQESQSGSPPIYQQYQLHVSGDSSFRFTKELGFTGAATIRTTVTFVVVKPKPRTASTTLNYVCTR